MAEKIVCPHNPECRCDTQECHKCGWNPEVANRRLKEYKKASGMVEKCYKIPFTGYCEVYAKSEEEALEKAEDVQKQFFAHYEYGNPVCTEKEEKDELD